jgi:hypothetical protein
MFEKKYDIKLDQDSYYIGEKVRGRVDLLTDKGIKAQNVVFYVYGQEKTNYTDSLSRSDVIIQAKIQNNPNYINEKEFLKLLLEYIHNSTYWADIKKKIISKYEEKIYILQHGELEDYLGLTNKDFQKLIDFCNNDFNNWYNNNNNRNELDILFNHILN